MRWYIVNDCGGATSERRQEKLLFIIRMPGEGCACIDRPWLFVVHTVVAAFIVPGLSIITHTHTHCFI